MEKGGELMEKGGELMEKGGELMEKGGELIEKGGELMEKGGELIEKGGELIEKGGVGGWWRRVEWEDGVVHPYVLHLGHMSWPRCANTSHTKSATPTAAQRSQSSLSHVRLLSNY